MSDCLTSPSHEDRGIGDRGIAVSACRSQVMTGCLLVGASYALLNTQTHAVGAVAAVGVEDSKVRAWMDARNRVRLIVEVDFARCWSAAKDSFERGVFHGCA